MDAVTLSYLFDAEMVYVRPRAVPALSTRLALLAVLEVEMLSELVPIVVGQEALHAHQLQRVGLAMAIQGLLVRLVLKQRDKVTKSKR